jgi:hypothetical protein
MAQRIVIPLTTGMGVGLGVKEAVINADLIVSANAVPDGINDNQIYLYLETGKYFTLTCTSSGVTDQVATAINSALIGKPSGPVLRPAVDGLVSTMGDTIDG